MTRSIVSFEAGEAAFPMTGEPPGYEPATFLSGALREQGFQHDGPDELADAGWGVSGKAGDVAVDCVIALVDVPPRHWEAHTHARLPLRRRLFSRESAESEREDALRRWCQAIDRALKGHEAVTNIRWHDYEDLQRDDTGTWAASP